MTNDGMTTTTKIKIDKSNELLGKNGAKNLRRDTPYPIKGVSARRAGGRVAIGKGYPEFTTDLSQAEVKEIRRLIKAAEQEGIGLNLCLTVKIEGIMDRKQLLREELSKLMKYLRRRDIPHYGISVYEKNPHDPDRKSELHLHHLFYCPKNYVAEVMNHFNKGTKLQTIRTHDGSFGYLTKQRQSLSPEIDARLINQRKYRFFHRRNGEFIAGKRWSATRLLKNKFPSIGRIPARRCIAIPLEQ